MMNAWAGLAVLFAAHAALGADCGPQARAWMPSASELASMCPGEPSFKGQPAQMGSAQMCHYQFGAMAGMMVSKDSAKSAKAAADDAGSMKIPGYVQAIKKLPWSGIEAYSFSMAKDGQDINPGVVLYVESKAGVFKVELWGSDRSKIEACSQKVVRSVMAKAK